MRYVAMFTLALLFAANAYAQNGTISGSVLDATTSMPLTLGALIVVHTEADAFASSTSVNASGQYELVLPPGTYFVRVQTDADYYTQLYDNIPCVASDCPFTAGTPVVVTSGGTTTVNFNMIRGGNFTGTVRRAADNSVVITSDLFLLVYNASGSFVQTVLLRESTYTARNLPAGTYYARVGTPSDSSSVSNVDFIPEMYGGIPCPAAFQADCRILQSTPISVTAGSTTTGIDFLLDPAATIEGRVTDALTGSPLTRVWIEALAGETRVAVALSDQVNGTYRITGLPAGTYKVRTFPALAQQPEPYVHEWHNDLCVGCAGTPTPIAVGAAATVSGIDFALSPAGSIMGTVRCGPDVRGTIARPTIEAFSATGERVAVGRYFSGGPPPPPGFFTGCYETPYVIDGLAPGQYYLRARDTPIWPFSPFFPPGGFLINELYGGIDCVASDCDVRRAVPVTVAAGGTTPSIDFNMRSGGGFVITIDGHWVTSEPLSIYDSRGVEIDRSSVLLLVPFGASSRIVGLPDGAYYVKVNGTLHDDIPCLGCPPTSGTPVIVRSGSTTPAVDIQTIGRRVSGTVRNEAGTTALSTITVELLSNVGTVVSSTLTDLNGVFRFAAVPAGTYFARTRNTRGFVDELYSEHSCSTCDPRNGTPIVVASSPVTGVDFTLAPSGVISGVVTEPTGVVIGNIPVALFTPGGALVGRTRSNPSGRFTFDVTAGSYRARADASTTHAAELFSELPCTSASCDVTTGTPIAVATATTTPNVNFSLASCSAMTLSPPVLATGVVGQSYRQVFTVAGGTAPFAFQVTSGVLPSGLTLDAASGLLAGTVSTSGRHEFTIGARDANECAAARGLTIDVQACAFVLSPTSATVPAAGGTVTINIGGACGSQLVTNATSFVHEQSNTPGQVVLLVDANTASAPRTWGVAIGRRVFTIRQAGTGSLPPFGSFDAPVDGSQVAGSIALGGWALDDLEVQRVQIVRDPVDGEGAGQVFLGNAVFVRGARPDVSRAYPTYPLQDRAGWGFLILTNMLPHQGNGPFRIYAYAEDAEGARTLLGWKTIIAVNAGATAPFGAIDTPGQGATIAGSAYVNFGWALTPQPKMIPFDGATIDVLIDGVSVGHPTYNQFRSDVSGLFPGLANSGGPVGYRILDTTALAEGQHTISWVVYDDAGAGAGIGSRFFNVANSADAQSADQSGVESGRRTESLASAPLDESTTFAQTTGRELQRLDAREDGVRAITLRATERLELTLETATGEPCGSTWAGYVVDKNTLGALPVGATIDPAGTFFWQPGPGFAGTFELMFVRTACDGAKRRLPVRVVVGG